MFKLACLSINITDMSQAVNKNVAFLVYRGQNLIESSMKHVCTLSSYHFLEHPIMIFSITNFKSGSGTQL